jgi:branched-chain amino acid transport system permease protein
MDYVLHTLIIANFFIPVVLGYNLLFGRGKVFHFGAVGTWAAVGYAITITLVSTGSGFLALGAGLAMAIVASAVLAWLSFRLEPDGFGVMTIAVHLVVLAVILNWNSLTRGALGIPGVPQLSFMKSIEVFALVTTMVSLLWIGLFAWIQCGAFGRKIDALAEHEWHAKSLGISRIRVHFWAFILLGISTVASVFFQPQYLRILHPNDFQFPSFVFLMMIIVAGKPGSLWGGVLSTFLLVFLREGLRFVPLAPSVLGPVRLILFGLILFIAVYVRRDTLFPKQRSI